MRTMDVILLSFTIVIVVLALLFGVGAVFIAEFRESGMSIAIGILGAVGSIFGTALGAAYITREVPRAGKKGNVKQDEDE